MKIKIKTMIISSCLVLLLSNLVHAGDKAGNGGDVVVCFGIDLRRAVNYNDEMTALGRKAITSVELYDFYKMGSNRYEAPTIKRIKDLNFEEAILFLRKQFSKVPVFFNQINETNLLIGNISDGFPAANGLENIADSGTDFGVPANCAIIQAVIREVDMITFDPDLWNELPAYQQALLQLHEEIYFRGIIKRHKDSTNTHLLIISILRSSPSPEELVQKLESLNFGWFSTLSKIKKAKVEIIQMLEIIISKMTFLTGYCPSNSSRRFNRQARLTVSEVDEIRKKIEVLSVAPLSKNLAYISHDLPSLYDKNCRSNSYSRKLESIKERLVKIKKIELGE
jgi:NTP pyrophosphatase (non-canonical NTP hydrolase)